MSTTPAKASSEKGSEKEVRFFFFASERSKHKRVRFNSKELNLTLFLKALMNAVLTVVGQNPDATGAELAGDICSRLDSGLTRVQAAELVRKLKSEDPLSLLGKLSAI